jgi:hypothetical protein
MPVSLRGSLRSHLRVTAKESSFDYLTSLTLHNGFFD